MVSKASLSSFHLPKHIIPTADIKTPVRFKSGSANAETRIKQAKIGLVAAAALLSVALILESLLPVKQIHFPS